MVFVRATKASLVRTVSAVQTIEISLQLMSSPVERTTQLLTIVIIEAPANAMFAFAITQLILRR